MPRRPFAASTDSVAWDPETGRAVPGAQVTVTRVDTGGTITDLLDMAGEAIPGGVVVAGVTGLFEFQGPPDDTDQVLVDAGLGPVLLDATDLVQRVESLETSTTDLAGQVTATGDQVDALDTSRGQPTGLATLDDQGQVPAAQLPPGQGPTRFVDLLDVAWTGARDGQVPTYQASSGLLVPGGIGQDVRVSDLAQPYVIAHRGGANLGPEHALPTYQQALKYTPLIEQDVQLLPDGTLAVMHDTTVDRTTNGLGEVIGYPPHQLKGLTLTASETYHHNYSDIPGGVVTLDEVFTEFGNQRAVFVVEVKGVSNAAACASALLDLITWYGYESRVIVQGWDLATLQPFIDAGIDTMYLWGSSATGVPTPSGMVSAGVTWAAPGTSVDDATIQSYAATLKTVVWTIDKQWQASKYTSLGCVGYFANDPAYLCGDSAKYQRTSSNFGSGLPDVGMTLPGAGGSDARYLDSIVDLDITGNPGHVSNYPYDQVQLLAVTHGYLCPLPPSCTLTFEAWYSQGDGSNTRWVSAFVGTTDQDFMDGAEVTSGLNGYHILFRVNGTIDIYKVTDGGSAGNIATGTSGPWADQTWETMTVTVSGSTITAQMAGGATVSTTDTTYRPVPYLTTRVNTAPSGTTMKFYQRNFQVS